MTKLSEVAKELFGQKSCPSDEGSNCGRDGHLKHLDHHKVEEFIELAIDILMPKMFHKTYDSSLSIESDIEKLHKSLITLLQNLRFEGPSEEIADHLINDLPRLYGLVESDMKAAEAGDPAASSLEEVIHSYPGPYAVAIFRLANSLFTKNVPILPRLITEFAHEKTGIDIHPGATIGHSLFIDHGTGVVIGETTHIGNNVKLYQGVTLGALSVEKEMAKKKRHPTIEDNCVIYSQATILGGQTVIGKDSVVGGNVWLTRSIPSHSLVYHRSEVKHDYTEAFKETQELTYEI